MFKWTNPKLEMAQSRIRDLELANERFLSQVNSLQETILELRNERNLLQEKLFDSVGLNRPVVAQRLEIPQRPISIGTKHNNWPQTRQTLEQAATEKALRATGLVVDTKIKEVENEIGITENAS